MRLLLISLLAFAAGLAVWIARGDDTPAAPRPERPVLTGTSGDIPTLQRAVRDGRDDLRPALAAAYLQRARETADPSFYAKAEGVLGTPRTPEALATAGELALARHDFRGALALGERAGAIGAPIRVDALVELGRYDDAERELQAMLDRKPNLAGYARASYLRELHGDLAGAVEAMRLAVAAGGPAAENVAYVGALLGELERRRGRDARRAARVRAGARARARAPGRRGRARAARGRRARRSPRLRRLVERLPLPEYAIALGEAELAAGREAAARRTSRSSPPSSSCSDAAGVDTDVELAVFEADHGDPQRAVELARRGWDAAPSTRSADALGWALTRAGDPRGRPALGAPRAEARVGRPALARPRRPRGARGRPSRRGPPAPAGGLAARPRRLAVAGAASETRAARLTCPSGEHRRIP